VSRLITAKAFENGLIIYPRRSINGLAGDHVIIAPPLIISADQVDEVLHWLNLPLAETTSDLLGANGMVVEDAVPEQIFSNP
jgi:adenosylmethionine-8-amino-7-oxononanoate aminotransferase